MSLESLEFWKDAFEIAGVVLLLLTFIVGAGALWFSKKLNTIQSRQIRQFDKDLTAAKLELGKQEERAARAEQSAAEAKQLAGGFEKEIAQSNARAAEANTKAEGFRLDIAKANERAASANETAEKERLARLQLEAKLADRTLTPQQQAAITTRLATMPGTVIDVIIFGDTPEIQIISGLVLDSVRKAGWMVNQGFAGGAGMAVRGILVGIRTDSDEKTVRAGSALITALQSEGLACGTWPFDELQRPSMILNSTYRGTAPIRVFIGSKP